MSEHDCVNASLTSTGGHGPEFRFVRSIYHPNIYHNGTVCISILHAPGEDEMSGELPAERWSPAQRVESVLISILSLLDDAEVSSPANVDAAVTLRKDFETYKAIVRETVEASKSDIPEDFIMPTHESSMTKPAVVEKDDPDFWAESDDDDEESFGGSDSDMQFDDTQDVDLDEMYYTDSNDDDDDDDVSFQEIEDIEEYKKKMRAQKEEKAKEKAKARAREQEQEQAEAEALAQN